MTTPYRYILEREMPAPLFNEVLASAPGMKGGARAAAVIMLNPSTATAETNDPTIRRLLGFARREGWEKMHVLNLFALRETDKAKFLRRAHARPRTAVGEKNDAVFRHVLFAELCPEGIAVVAWGQLPRWAETRALQVFKMLRAAELPVYSLGEPTRDGHPRHPLYLRSDVKLSRRDPDYEIARMLNRGVKDYFS